MAISSSPTGQPNSAAAMKERRARDAAQAMRDHEAKRVAVLAKTARLRAMRLAKEAEARQLCAQEDKIAQEGNMTNVMDHSYVRGCRVCRLWQLSGDQSS